MTTNFAVRTIKAFVLLMLCAQPQHSLPLRADETIERRVLEFIGEVAKALGGPGKTILVASYATVRMKLRDSY